MVKRVDMAKIGRLRAVVHPILRISFRFVCLFFSLSLLCGGGPFNWVISICNSFLLSILLFFLFFLTYGAVARLQSCAFQLHCLISMGMRVCVLKKYGMK